MIKKNKKYHSNENEFTIHDELYFIDFGLAEKYTQYISAGSQRERTQRNGVAGTPSYASLDILAGYSPCRKDDIESLVRILFFLFYFILLLILQILNLNLGLCFTFIISWW